MRAVVQRVSEGSVRVEEDVTGAIETGLMVLLGVGRGDTDKEARYLADKISGLRIFEDEAGKMNRSLEDVGGAMLVVSQFTLYGDCSKGRRPSFIDAAPPQEADELYTTFIEAVRFKGIPVETGRFQTHMQVSLTNDGPVTLIVESK
ncbi:D-aminoacyl-tRNA deacylase [Desulfoluna spongiiphila]|uniref:D-aminoacyl-tRNA deacylase n=1 Tax=Desulfoluna spongiiphila TaxID=419481 RepID=UPI00125437E5|nr:D-aminoacyl-tRNA deacylase [Desulfoluna spongiiphila]VVS95483.1 d-aminoacyl-trna deacylase dtd [Desulfoluna spongiiphila]